MSHPRLGQVDATITVLHQLVVDICSHTNREIGRQRPRRSSPNREMCVFIFELEQHGDGRILHILIVRGGFKICQRGAQRRR